MKENGNKLLLSINEIQKIRNIESTNTELILFFY